MVTMNLFSFPHKDSNVGIGKMRNK